MDYHWYPGHMTKTIRQMQEDMKLIDLVIEIADARLPRSSRNPDIETLAAGKARMILLNKADLADPEGSEAWRRALEEEGLHPVLIDARKNGSLKSLTPMILKACQVKIERNRRRGIQNRPVRAMVAGIPNVGKSTFINSFAGSAAAKTGNKPGVTRGKQWIRMNKQVELLDTPGLLWPKFEDQEVGKRLAMIGSIRDEVLNTEELSLEVIAFLAGNYPGKLAERYGVSVEEIPADVLTAVGRRRGCLVRGGEIDTEKAARLLLEEFRAGTIGRFTLERP